YLHACLITELFEHRRCNADNPPIRVKRGQGIDRVHTGRQECVPLPDAHARDKQWVTGAMHFGFAHLTSATTENRVVAPPCHSTSCPSREHDVDEAIPA